MMRLYPIALAAALLPLVTIHACYLWAASNGHVAWCFPYLESCTSISAVGRQAPEFFLFKALMIPSAVFITAYWFLCCQWLVRLGCTAGKRRLILLSFGVIACAGLILYSVMLGAMGDIYRLQRRIGVTGFFGLTYLAQLLLTWLLGKTPRIRQFHRYCLRWLEAVGGIILMVGVASVILSIVDYSLYERTDNAFEWSFTFLLCTQVFVTGLLWKSTDFKSEFRVH